MGAEVIAFSDKTGVEMFTMGDHILGIQGHPEYTKDILNNLIDRLLNSSCIEVTKSFSIFGFPFAKNYSHKSGHLSRKGGFHICGTYCKTHLFKLMERERHVFFDDSILKRWILQSKVDV